MKPQRRRHGRHRISSLPGSITAKFDLVALTREIACQGGNSQIIELLGIPSYSSLHCREKGEVLLWRWIEGRAVEISAEAETGGVDDLGDDRWEKQRRDDGKGGHCRGGRLSAEGATHSRSVE